MPVTSIVGLGPSDARLLTVGALESLQQSPRVFACNAAPATIGYLKEHGVAVEPVPFDGSALLRGVETAVQAAVAALAQGDAALGVPGHPLLDFPGLPHLLRELERHGIEVSDHSRCAARRALRGCGSAVAAAAARRHPPQLG